jgi:hypothetical protein
VRGKSHEKARKNKVLSIPIMMDCKLMNGIVTDGLMMRLETSRGEVKVHTLGRFPSRDPGDPFHFDFLILHVGAIISTRSEATRTDVVSFN